MTSWKLLIYLSRAHSNSCKLQGAEQEGIDVAAPVGSQYKKDGHSVVAANQTEDFQHSYLDLVWLYAQTVK